MDRGEVSPHNASANRLGQATSAQGVDDLASACAELLRASGAEKLLRRDAVLPAFFADDGVGHAGTTMGALACGQTNPTCPASCQSTLQPRA